jgi:hypothetical protein
MFKHHLISLEMNSKHFESYKFKTSLIRENLLHEIKVISGTRVKIQGISGTRIKIQGISGISGISVNYSYLKVFQPN